jgi:hypothetical protein
MSAAGIEKCQVSSGSALVLGILPPDGTLATGVVSFLIEALRERLFADVTGLSTRVATLRM